MRALALMPGSEQGETVRLIHFEHGKSSGCHEHISHPRPKWDVDSFIKNGGSFFTGCVDPEAALVW